jgi:hypothetical protein
MTGRVKMPTESLGFSTRARWHVTAAHRRCQHGHGRCVGVADSGLKGFRCLLKAWGSALGLGSTSQQHIGGAGQGHRRFVGGGDQGVDAC